MQQLCSVTRINHITKQVRPFQSLNLPKSSSTYAVHTVPCRFYRRTPSQSAKGTPHNSQKHYILLVICATSAHRITHFFHLSGTSGALVFSPPALLSTSTPSPPRRETHQSTVHSDMTYTKRIHRVCRASLGRLRTLWIIAIAQELTHVRAQQPP